MMNSVKLLLSGSRSVIERVKRLLPPYVVPDCAFSGGEVLRKIAANPPAVLIADYALPDMTAPALVQSAGFVNAFPVIILVDAMQSVFADDLKKDFDFVFCLTKPANARLLDNALSLALRFHKKIRELEKQADSLKTELAERKAVERAKGVLMREFGLSEDEAYGQMRRKAMNSCSSLFSVAKQILEER
jgi:response regulator NasT